ncbi:MAG: single-strand DNA-binding protein [Sphingobacteriales bacterium]|jgi:single-strand DNA-binding protein
MSGVNKVILIGNLGKDPEVRYLDNDIAVARFTLATSETFKDKTGEKRTNTEWHNVVLWRGLAKISEQYLKKGNQVYIEGKLKTSQYEKEGQTKYITEVQATNMTLLGGKPADSGSGNYNEAPQAAAAPQKAAPAKKASEAAPENQDQEEDDLPF